METRTKIMGTLFVSSILTGLLLHITGRPLVTSIFTIHKLLALAFIITAVVMIVKLWKKAIVDSLSYVLMGVGALSFIVLLISGAILSLEKTGNEVALNIHNVATIILVISTMAAFQSLKRSVRKIRRTTNISLEL